MGLSDLAELNELAEHARATSPYRQARVGIASPMDGEFHDAPARVLCAEEHLDVEQKAIHLALRREKMGRLAGQELAATLGIAVAGL